MPVLENTSISFAHLLAPVPPFDSPGLPNVSSLDLLGALRLSIIIRQLRRHTAGLAGPPKGLWWHDLFMTMVVVFGGEMIAGKSSSLMKNMPVLLRTWCHLRLAALLVVPPSFMISPTITLLFIWSHTLANALPEILIPNLGIQTELPLSLLDAMTRSMLVCDGVVSLIKNNPNPLLRVSPTALLVTSVVRLFSWTSSPIDTECRCP